MHAKKILTKITIVSFAFILMAGCSKNENLPNPSSTVSSTSPSSNLSSAVSSAVPNAVSSSIPEDSALLTKIMESAKKGMIIDCEFPVKTTVIEDVTAKWGKADKSDYITSAKGEYSSFSKQKIVFGFNKGSQIFEARTFNSKLDKITLSKVKELYGKPAYTSSSKDEDIIGYVAGKEFKILLVFPHSTDNKTDPVLDHYSVLYPDGTVNSMANDPGRKW